MRQTLLLTAICSLPLIAVADEYNFEVDGLASHSKVPNSNSTLRIDLDTYMLGLTYYTSAVDDSLGPYAQAAFLNKASSFNLAYGMSDSDEASGEIDSVGLGMRTIFSEKYIVELAYGQAERDEVSGSEESDIKSYGLGLGVYTADNAALTANYAVIDDDFDTDESKVASLGFEGVVEADGNDYLGGSIVATYTSFGNASDAMNFDIEMEYYFNQKISISALLGMESVSGDGKDTNLYGVGARYFLSNSLALALAYERQDIADSEDDDAISLDDPESITLSLTGRF